MLAELLDTQPLTDVHHTHSSGCKAYGVVKPRAFVPVFPNSRWSGKQHSLLCSPGKSCCAPVPACFEGDQQQESLQTPFVKEGIHGITMWGGCQNYLKNQPKTSYNKSLCLQTDVCKMYLDKSSCMLPTRSYEEIHKCLRCFVRSMS